MADISEGFEVLKGSQNNTMAFHLSLGARIALIVYVSFLMVIGIIANTVFLLIIKRNPRVRRSAGTVSLIYLTILNLTSCCLLNSFSLAAILNEKTRQSVLYCRFYLVFSTMFMKLFAWALIVASVVSGIELVRWTVDKKRLKLGSKMALVASSLFVIADSAPLYNHIEITPDPTCFVVRDGNPIRTVWIAETLVTILLPFIACIVTLFIAVKKIRETKSKVAAHAPKAHSNVDKGVSLKRKRNVKGTDQKSVALVDASQSILTKIQSSSHSVPSSSSSTAMAGGQEIGTTSDADRGPIQAWNKTVIEDSAPEASGKPKAKHRPMNLCYCGQFILGEEVRMVRLTFYLFMTLIISWTPSAVMVGGTQSSSPTFLDYILIRVSYLTTIHPSVIPLAFLYTNKYFEGGFVVFFRSLRNRKAKRTQKS